MVGIREETAGPDNVVLDGIQYELRQTEQHPGYHVAWQCSACGTEVTGLPATETKKKALDRAMANLISHHILVHTAKK